MVTVGNVIVPKCFRGGWAGTDDGFMLILMLFAIVPAQQDSLSRSVRRIDRLIAQERLAEAVRMARQIAAAFPESSEASAAAGDAVGALAGRSNVVTMIRLARECRGRYERAVRLDSTNARALEGLAAFYAQAPRLIGGNRDAARAMAKRLERILPARGMVARAIIDAREDPAQGDSLVAAVLRMNPDTVAFSRVITYFELTDRPRRALELEMVQLTRNPGSAVRWYAVGRLQLMVADTNGARDHFREAWRHAREDRDSSWIAPVRPAWRLAQLGARQSRREDTLAWLDSILAVDPTHVGARRMKDSLRARSR